LKVKVHAADIMDRDGARLVLRGIKKQYPNIQHLWQDAAYNGKNLNGYIEARGWTVQTIKRSRSRFRIVEEQYIVKIDKSKFEVLPRRWVVERTFGWFSRYRRLSKDYEFSPDTSENMIYLAMIRNMLRRLTHRSRRF
jgi:putative transposase